MRRLVAAFLAIGCGGGHPPIPNLADPTCGSVEIEVVTAPADQCVHMVPSSGDDTRFRRLDDDRCGGDACIVLQPGESAVVVGAYDDFSAHYYGTTDACDALPTCP